MISPLAKRLTLVVILLNSIIGIITVICNLIFKEVYSMSGFSPENSVLTSLIIIWGIGGYLTTSATWQAYNDPEEKQ